MTWLYGPLQEAQQVNRRWSMTSTSRGSKKTGHAGRSEPPNHLSKNHSFLKKPILKRRSVSEVMLQKSLSTSSLVRQAAAAVQAQRSGRRNSAGDPPKLSRSSTSSVCAQTAPLSSLLPSETSTGLQSPEGDKKHIRFHDTVEQCIAVDFKSGESTATASWMQEEDSDSSEDNIVMMKQSPRDGQMSAPGSRRDSFGQENKGIAMLPSAPLKYHHDEPHCPGHPDRPSTPRESSSGRLSHTSSQETLRPSKPSTNFLLDDEDDDMSWEPSGTSGSSPSHTSANEERSPSSKYDMSENHPSGLRRTPSGMFMPYDSDEEEERVVQEGMFGRVVNTVNTARDIFSVIYNVGWRS